MEKLVLEIGLPAIFIGFACVCVALHRWQKTLTPEERADLEAEMVEQQNVW